MDGSRFDQIARAVAEGRSRRSFLRLAAGAVVALVAAGVRGADAAVCRPDGTTCRKPGHCCNGVCGPKDRTGRQRCGCEKGFTPLNGSCCPTANVCGDVCLDSPCAQGLTCCASEGACVDLSTDPQHCGACDTPVDVDRGEVCCSGDICSANDACEAVLTNTSMSICVPQPTASSTATNTATATVTASSLG